jgi:hypothetical protein
MRTVRWAVLVAVVAMVARAGAARAQMVHDWGITAGLNIAKFGGPDAGNASNRYDFMLGLSHLHSLTPTFGLQPELLYSRQGSKITENGTEATVKLSYIEVPVLAKFSFPMSGSGPNDAKPAIYVGPYAAFKISCDIEGTDSGVTVSGDCDKFDIKAKSYDFGLVGGAGVDFGALNVFARYSFGLVKLDDSATDQQDVKNRVITVGGRWSIASMK